MKRIGICLCLSTSEEVISVTVVKRSGKNADEESFHFFSGSTLLYSSPLFVDYDTVTLVVDLPANDDLLYTLVLRDKSRLSL